MVVDAGGMEGAGRLQGAEKGRGEWGAPATRATHRPTFEVALGSNWYNNRGLRSTAAAATAPHTGGGSVQRSLHKGVLHHTELSSRF